MYGMDKKPENNINSEVTKAEYQNPAGKFSAFCFEWLESITQAIILVVFLMTFAFRYMGVQGSSMMSTLHDGDKLIVSRWNYTPKTGDIVAITRGQDVNIPIIKRVIAVENQTLEIDFSTCDVTVDGVKLDEFYVNEPKWQKGDNEIPSVVPKGYVFVMGDNRNFSSDSRSKVIGLIPKENIIGKAVFRIFPFNRFGSLR